MQHHGKALDADNAGPLPMGPQLRRERERAGITLTGMANRIGLTKGYLSAIETGIRPVTLVVRDLYERELQQTRSAATAQEAAPMSRSQVVEQPQVVIAGTLRSLPRRDQLRLVSVIDEPVRHLCDRLDLSCSVPDRTPLLVGESDSDFEAAYPVIKQAGVLLAYVGVSDARTGIELAFAHMAQVPIILLYEAGNSRVADDFRRSNIPVYREISFRAAADLEDELGQSLFWLFSFRNLVEAARRWQWPTAEYEQQRQQLEQLRRQARKLVHLRPPITPEAWKRGDALRELEGDLALA